MKVDLILNREQRKIKSEPSFTGFSIGKTDEGYKELVVNCPYDPKNEDCYLEVYKLGKDKYGNYFPESKCYTKDRKDSYQLQDKNNRIDIAKTFGIPDDQPFGIHYLIKNKHNHSTKVFVDGGDIINDISAHAPFNIFNVVMPNRSKVSRGGSMKLVIIDSHNVGKVYNDQNVIVEDNKLKQRGLNTLKTLTNKFGGTLAGLEDSISKGEFDSYDRIVSLPIFTDDDFSAAAYWNKNCFQMVSSLGNINNYASLQRKMFTHGLNFVSDGAFVNEGLQGVHFKNLLKYGETSPYRYWFKASSLADGPLSLGIFSKNKDYISHKVVNHPKIFKQDINGTISWSKNLDYDPKKPTYIQYFDVRLVSEKERNDHKNLIKDYEKSNTNNVYDLHTHNDSVYLYAVDIDPKIYDKNIEQLNQYIKKHAKNDYIALNGPLAARIVSQTVNHITDGKFESGFETWDANPDIAKLSFSYSNADYQALMNMPEKARLKEEANILRGNYQVQDYTVESGKYWTQKTDDIQRLYTAQTLKNIDIENPALFYTELLKLADGNRLPKAIKTKVSKAEIENVLFDTYKHKRTLSKEDKRSQIIEGLMNTPLDSIELGDNIVATLASPLISKRASVPEDIGVSRYDLFKAGNKNLPEEYAQTYLAMEKIYTQSMADFATKILDIVDKNLPNESKLFNENEVTEYGKYVLPLLTPEIAKFAVIKSLVPNTRVAVNSNNGEISYNYKELKNTHLQGLGITNPASPKQEATDLLKKINNGIKNLKADENSELVASFLRTLKDTTVENFKIADLIIDKTQSGLDWRIDATKDIADVESLRNGNSTFDYTWGSIIDFWKKFTQGVLSKNPNSYIVAEVTNERDLYKAGLGYSSKKYQHPRDIVSKFLRETGVTSIANYSYFFSTVSNLFTRSFENGRTVGEDTNYIQGLLSETMIGKPGDADKIPFIRSGSMDSLIYSYTFIGNHDKPRALHCAALDMDLFYSDLTDRNNFENRRKAYILLNNKYFKHIQDYEVHEFDFSRVSPKAVAMGDAIRPALINQIEKMYKPKCKTDDEFNSKYFEPISKAVSDLTNGRFLGKNFNPEAFGCKPIDTAIEMAIKQAKQMYGFGITPETEKEYKDSVFELTMTKAMDKLKAMMKYLVALPGLPTLYDGDDVGSTGYDTETKNMFLQGRQRIRNEWLDTNSQYYNEFIAKNYKEFDSIMALRKNPNCAALNDGAIYPLVLQSAIGGGVVPAIFRQNTDGKMAISLFNTTALNTDFRTKYEPKTQKIDKIYLNQMGDMLGIPSIKHDIKFVNAQDENDIYYTKIDNKGQYYLQRVVKDKDVPTEINDATLVLYHVPPNEENKTEQKAAILSSAQAIKSYQHQPITATKQLAIK